MPKALSRLEFTDQLPNLRAVAEPSRSLVIFDRRLLRVSSEFRKWIGRFPNRYAVDSGENLKSLDDFPAHVRKIEKLAATLAPRTMTVVAVGGGSVGDFAGFFASVYKRGVRLVHVPSTWLAAIDSSHGGKTALNSAGAKNQIGSFYPAECVVLVRSLLFAQPDARARDALAELAKIAIIDGGSWVREMERSNLAGADLIWRFLRPAIAAKMKIVARDPRETSGARQVLNLGHTVGHALEAAHRWTHGHAVAQGLFFAIEFARKRGELGEPEARRALALLERRCRLERARPKSIAARKFATLIAKDKKRNSERNLMFISLGGFGRPLRVPVSIDALVKESRAQGWVK